MIEQECVKLSMISYKIYNCKERQPLEFSLTRENRMLRYLLTKNQLFNNSRPLATKGGHYFHLL